MELKLLKEKHATVYGEKPELIVFAPGRVNLIGDHTDYSEGFVMPMAIPMGISVAISKIPDSKVISVFSIDYDKKMVCMYSDLMKSSVEWFNYPVGVVKEILKMYPDIDGVRITFTGNVPQGAGLSSSAALEMAVAYGIQKLYNLKIEDTKLAKICRQAEHEIVGVKCGIMDQFISRMGKKDNALLIDCRSLEYRLVPLKLKNYKIILTNSNVPHKLSSSLYNQRVIECGEAVKMLGGEKENLTLRDFTLEDFNKNKDFLPEDLQKRAFHVISENQRVLEAEKALKNNDLHQFGFLMNESQESLMKNYEVSSPELDWLTDAANSCGGCVGSRMTGAGFGGCTVSLMDDKAFKEYAEKLKNYETQFGYKAITYEVSPSNGVELL